MIIAPGHVFPLSWDDLITMWPDNRCFLVALDERQLNVIHSSLSLAYYYKSFWGMPHRRNWQQSDVDRWDTIHAFVAGLEDCLMSGCNVEDLIASVDALTVAVTGGFNAVNVLALDTIRDTLSAWQVQDNTDQVARNTQLTAINTEMDAQTALDTNRNDRLGDIDSSVGIVGDRIAPNGSDLYTPTALIGPAVDTIPPSIDALTVQHKAFTDAFIECCEKQQMLAPANELPDISFGGVDAEKCDFAARMIGTHYQFMKEIKIYGPILVNSYAFALGVLASFGVGIKSITTSLVAQIATQLSIIVWADFLDSVIVVDGALDKYHQAIYEATTPQDAQTAIYAVSDTLTFVNSNSKAVANLLMGNMNSLTLVFLKDDYYLQNDYGDWYTGDCSEYSSPGYAGTGPITPCTPPLTPADARLTIGQPRNIYYPDGSLINNAYTFTSEYDGIALHIVNIRLLGEYYITVNSISRSVNVEIWDACPTPNVQCYVSNTTADGVPSTYKGTIIILKTSDGSFTADLDFNVNLSEDYGC